MKWVNSCVAFCLLCLLPIAARAQLPDYSGDSMHVYLITLGPGSDPWEKFGHDFIDIEDPTRLLTDPRDESRTVPFRISYNWGVFDFGHGVSGFTTFGWHFLQGKLVYSMRGALTDEVIAVYTREGRFILKQELELTSQQKVELLHRLDANDTDANRYYLYDYFTKNCSSMMRDAIDQTVNGKVHEVLSKIPSGTTYRLQDRRCTADDLWLYIFLDYALGHPVDQPLSAWQESFLPEKLAAHLREVMVPGLDGKQIPLVKSEQVLNAGRFPERAVAPAWFFYGFLGAGVGFAGLLCALASFSDKSRPARWSFKILATAWSLLAGVLGLLVSLVWLTDHQAAKWNENWFQGNLLSLLLMVLIPASNRWPALARRAAFAVLGLSVFGLLMKLTPWFYQVNGQLIAAALPIHTAIAWGIMRLTASGKAPVPIEESDTAALRAG